MLVVLPIPGRPFAFDQEPPIKSLKAPYTNRDDDMWAISFFRNDLEAINRVLVTNHVVEHGWAIFFHPARDEIRFL
jgi:hypothetical protein